MRALQPDKSKADEIKEELKQQIMVSTWNYMDFVHKIHKKTPVLESLF